MSMRTKAEQAAELPNVEARGLCATAGPWGYICTDELGHSYSCYDASLDTSFNRRWAEDIDAPPENHPCDCRCTECK
jgi:hypothetical protein